MSDDELFPVDDVPQLPSAEIRAKIERLTISADAKALLMDIAVVTVEVGGKIVRAGQRILSFIFDLVQRFPNTAFGLIAAYVVSVLVTSIPAIGWIIGPMLTPLLLAFGLAQGALADIRDGALRSRVSRFERELATATAA